MLRDVKQTWPDGIYHLFYDGEGVIDFGFDSKIIESNEKYRMKIILSTRHSWAYYQKSLGDPNQVMGVRTTVTMTIQ